MTTRERSLYFEVLDDIAEKARTGEVQTDVNCGLCGGPGTYVWLRDDTQPDPFSYLFRCSGCCSDPACRHWASHRENLAAAARRSAAFDQARREGRLAEWRRLNHPEAMP